MEKRFFFFDLFFAFFLFFFLPDRSISSLSLFHKVAVRRRRRRRRSVWRHFLALFFSLRNPPPSIGRGVCLSRACVFCGLL